MSTTCAKIFLHQLVSELVQSLLPLTIKRNNIVLNEIPRDLCVRADENMLAYIFWNLINAAIQSNQNECIHIEAIPVGDSTMLRLKNAGAYFHRTISREYRQVQYVAEQLGATISIS